METTAQSAKNLPPGAVLRLLRASGGVPAGAVLRPVTAKTAKPAVHATNDVATLRDAAKDRSEVLGEAVAGAARQVPGAKLDAVRDAKDGARIGDKADRQSVQPSQIGDISAAKVTVPDQQAAEQVLEHLHGRLPVAKAEGAVDGKPGKNGVRQVQAMVALPENGNPVKQAEVLLQTPEMAKATDGTHDDYRAMQDAEAGGKAGLAARLRKKIEPKHEKAAAEADKRINGDQKGETKYKFGSTQANIPADSEAAKALKSAQRKIAPEDRAGDVNDAKGGIVAQHHVTVRYGIQGDDVEGIKSYIASQPAFEATLGKTASFPATEHSDGAAPIIAPIDSPDLRRMEAELDKHGDFKERSFPDYKPHATLGYVKPDSAKKYTGMPETDGKKFTVQSISISDRNGNLTEVPLKGVENSAQVQQPAAAATQRWRAGRQATPVEIQHTSGNWDAGTLRHWSPGYNGMPAQGRVELKDGKMARGVAGEALRMPQTAEPKSNGAQEHEPKPIGEPIGGEVGDLVRQRIAAGQAVKIFSRRVSEDPTGEKRRDVEAWTQKDFGTRLPVTDVKTAEDGAIYDDSANVEHNTGRILAATTNPGDAHKPVLVDLDGTLAHEEPHQDTHGSGRPALAAKLAAKGKVMRHWQTT